VSLKREREMNETRYPTAPIESWVKGKELRRLHFRRTWEAASQGRPIIMGVHEGLLGYLAGWEPYANPSYGPYYTALMRNPSELTKVLETFEAQGHPREICSSMRCYLGQLYAGLSTRSPTGGTIKPDLVFQITTCHTMAQTGQLFAEKLGVPYLSLDQPFIDSPNAREYEVAQLQEGIEFMEKATGRKYDDERLIEGTINEWDCMLHWARISKMCQNIPAPADLRQLWSLRMPFISMRHTSQAVEYAHMLYDEMRHRVERGISARGFECMRFLHEGFPPFHFIDILKQPYEYGAIYVTCENNLAHGIWERKPDGTWVVGKSLEEMGRVPRSREDALRLQVELYQACTLSSTWYPRRRPEEAVRRAQDWHCDAAIIGLDRGCHGYATSILETKMALQNAGCPVGSYEHAQADPRDFSLPHVLDGLEAFMESLGLTKV
jgi:benzoyl-CoA reductase subunit B